MIETLLYIVFILVLHYIGDFLLQTHKIASNKYKCGKELFIHGFIYLIVMSFAGPIYAIINAILHVAVDSITSKITHTLYEQKKYGAFFKVIGLDQLLHSICLILTYIKLIL